MTLYLLGILISLSVSIDCLIKELGEIVTDLLNIFKSVKIRDAFLENLYRLSG